MTQEYSYRSIRELNKSVFNSCKKVSCLLIIPEELIEEL